MRSVWIWAAAAVAAGTGAASAETQTDNFNRVIVFGDSLSDAGYFRTGKFTTNAANIATPQISSQLLAQRYGAPTGPGWLINTNLADLSNPNANPGNWNFAIGGARVNLVGSNPAIRSITDQVNFFRTAFGGTNSAGARDLVYIQGGPNDLFALAPTVTPANIATVQGQMAGFGTALGALVADPAIRNAGLIVLATIPDTNLTPFGNALTADQRAGGAALVGAFNTAFVGSIVANGRNNVVILDSVGFLRTIAADPAKFGFNPATFLQPACTPPTANAVTCFPAGTPGATATYAAGAEESFFFADDRHPSTGGQRAAADYIASVLDAPDTIAKLPVVFVSQIDLNRASINDAMDGALAGQGSLFGGVTGGVQEDGSSYGVQLGWATPIGEKFGFGVIAGFEDGQIELTGLEVDHQNIRVSAFAGAQLTDRFALEARGTVLYVNMDTVDRRVTINRAVLTESGASEARGWNATARASYAFGAGDLKHGPFAEISTETLNVDGYNEGGPSPFALRFGDQEFQRTLGSIGYEIDYRDSSPRGLGFFARGAYVDAFETDNGDVVNVSVVNTGGLWAARLPAAEDGQGFGRAEIGVSGGDIFGARLTAIVSGEFGDDNRNNGRIVFGLTKAF